MKKIAIGALLALVAAIPAQAADMPVKAAPLVALYNWSGFYIGGNLGYSWGRSSTDLTSSIAGVTTSGSLDMEGWVGGGQIGVNWQTGATVWGLEADIQATGQKGSASANCPTGVCVLRTAIDATWEHKLTWLATFRGRLGWTVTPTTLFYVTGGLAVGEVKTDATLTTTLNSNPPTVTSASGSSSSTKTGWTVGAGIETALGASNWTGKVEYLYVDLGSNSNTVTAALPLPPPTSITVTTNSRFTDHIFRVGLNYRFGR
jgi:outer membrane immunogenic protein